MWTTPALAFGCMQYATRCRFCYGYVCFKCVYVCAHKINVQEAYILVLQHFNERLPIPILGCLDQPGPWIHSLWKTLQSTCTLYGKISIAIVNLHVVQDSLMQLHVAHCLARDRKVACILLFVMLHCDLAMFWRACTYQRYATDWDKPVVMLGASYPASVAILAIHNLATMYKSQCSAIYNTVQQSPVNTTMGPQQSAKPQRQQLWDCKTKLICCTAVYGDILSCSQRAHSLYLHLAGKLKKWRLPH